MAKFRVRVTAEMTLTADDEKQVLKELKALSQEDKRFYREDHSAKVITVNTEIIPQ